jgi:hypothetical protein
MEPSVQETKWEHLYSYRDEHQTSSILEGVVEAELDQNNKLNRHVITHRLIDVAPAWVTWTWQICKYYEIKLYITWLYSIPTVWPYLSNWRPKTYTWEQTNGNDKIIMCILFHKYIEQQPARHHIAFPIEDMKNKQFIIEKQVQNLRAGCLMSFYEHCTFS